MIYGSTLRSFVWIREFDLKKKCMKRVCEIACSWNGPDDEVIKPQLGGFITQGLMIVRYVDLFCMIHVPQNKQEAMCRRPKVGADLTFFLISSRLKLYVCFLHHTDVRQ